MLCSVCNEREARIHLCQFIGGNMTKVDLCEVCGKEYVDLPQNDSRPPPVSDTLDRIVDCDPRYPKKAYLFVLGAIAVAYDNRLANAAARRSIDLSAGDLLEAFRHHARASFKTNARVILNSWGICNCQDFGEIIFNLVDAKLLAKHAEETKEAFQGGYEFDKSFPSE